MQDVELVAEILNGRQKRCEYMLNMASTPMETEPVMHAEASAPDYKGNGHRREQLDRRVVEGVGEDRVFERDHVQAVDVFEVVVGALFAVEELDDAHAADVFLGEAVDASKLIAASGKVTMPDGSKSSPTAN